MRRLNQYGFSIHLLLPIIVVLAIGAIGVRLLTASHASTTLAGTVANGPIFLIDQPSGVQTNTVKVYDSTGNYMRDYTLLDENRQPLPVGLTITKKFAGASPDGQHIAIGVLDYNPGRCANSPGANTCSFKVYMYDKNLTNPKLLLNQKSTPTRYLNYPSRASNDGLGNVVWSPDGSQVVVASSGIIGGSGYEAPVIKFFSTATGLITSSVNTSDIASSLGIRANDLENGDLYWLPDTNKMAIIKFHEYGHANAFIVYDTVSKRSVLRTLSLPSNLITQGFDLSEVAIESNFDANNLVGVVSKTLPSGQKQKVSIVKINTGTGALTSVAVLGNSNTNFEYTKLSVSNDGRWILFNTGSNDLYNSFNTTVVRDDVGVTLFSSSGTVKKLFDGYESGTGTDSTGRTYNTRTSLAILAPNSNNMLVLPSNNPSNYLYVYNIFSDTLSLANLGTVEGYFYRALWNVKLVTAP